MSNRPHHPLAAIVDAFDLRPVVRGSRWRYGKLRARGVPAILLGVAAIVAAAGATAALRRGAELLPETLRETRALLLAARMRLRELPGPNA